MCPFNRVQVFGRVDKLIFVMLFDDLFVSKGSTFLSKEKNDSRRRVEDIETERKVHVKTSFERKRNKFSSCKLVKKLLGVFSVLKRNATLQKGKKVKRTQDRNSSQLLLKCFFVLSIIYRF